MMPSKAKPSALELQPAWSESFGMWSGRANAVLGWLESQPCLKGRFAAAPSQDAETLGASGYINYNLRIPPGSVVWGFAMPDGAEFLTATQMQVTDIALGHQWFQEPIDVASLRPLHIREAWFPAIVLLPVPHPITGDGLILVEFWGPEGSTVFTLLAIAEVAACPKL